MSTIFPFCASNITNLDAKRRESDQFCSQNAVHFSLLEEKMAFSVLSSDRCTPNRPLNGQCLLSPFPTAPAISARPMLLALYSLRTAIDICNLGYLFFVHSSAVKMTITAPYSNAMRLGMSSLIISSA
jgi:hypothetical protein